MTGINAEYRDSESPDPLIGVLVRDEPDDEEDEEEDEGDGKEDGEPWARESHHPSLMIR